MTAKKNTTVQTIVALVLIAAIAVGGYTLFSTPEDETMPSDQDNTGPNGENGDTTPPQQDEQVLDDLNTIQLCDADTALGYVGCTPQNNGGYNVTIINEADRDNVEVPLIGVRYVFFNGENEALGSEKEKVMVVPEKNVSVTVPFDEYPDATDFVVQPIVRTDGNERVCYNHRLLVNIEQACY